MFDSKYSFINVKLNFLDLENTTFFNLLNYFKDNFSLLLLFQHELINKVIKKIYMNEFKALIIFK